MCSQLSRRRTPSPREHLETLRSCLVDVAQESFFSFAEPCSGERFRDALEMVDGAAAGSGGRWLSAYVDFDGAFAGRVTVVVPYALAVDMAAAIAGLAPGDPIDELLVLDATGEFANMVCGTWLTRACIHRRFDLRPPTVRAMPGMPPAQDDGEEHLLINDWPVKLGVAFVPA